MTGISIQTRAVLRDQDYESRLRNVREELIKQLEMQDWKIQRADDSDRLADLGLVGTSSSRLARIIEQHFPFISDGQAIVDKAHTVKDLVNLILEKV